MTDPSLVRGLFGGSPAGTNLIASGQSDFPTIQDAIPSEGCRGFESTRMGLGNLEFSNLLSHFSEVPRIRLQYIRVYARGHQFTPQTLNPTKPKTLLDPKP